MRILRDSPQCTTCTRVLKIVNLTAIPTMQRALAINTGITSIPLTLIINTNNHTD